MTFVRQNVAAAKLQAHWRGKILRRRMNVDPNYMKTVDMLLLRRAVEQRRRRELKRQAATKLAAPPPEPEPTLSELRGERPVGTSESSQAERTDWWLGISWRCGVVRPQYRTARGEGLQPGGYPALAHTCTRPPAALSSHVCGVGGCWLAAAHRTAPSIISCYCSAHRRHRRGWRWGCCVPRRC